QSSDGDPMDTIAPGASRTYTYPNKQTHAALWYHDHAHHMESENVYRGLSGFYLLRDQTELALPLPSGQYDIPIMLRDARIDDTGTLVYEMHDFMNRTTILANGKPWPYLQVAARKYRFRILNSTNLRFFTLHLSDNTDITQIGTDGGLLEKPLTTQTIALTPGERADIIIDFSRYKPGTQITLDNTEGPGPTELVGKILRFDITHTTPDPSTIPTTLRTL
ncbi:bilirubin oxidase, partial [Streptomyces sp. NRRL B-1568]